MPLFGASCPDLWIEWGSDLTYAHFFSVRNFYQQFGGEDQVVLQELERLKESHDVCFYSRHNDELLQLGPVQKANAALATVHSHRTKTDMRAWRPGTGPM